MDGRRPGAVVADGRYTFEVDGRDRAGNRSIVRRQILVDRTIRSVAWSTTSFDPRAGQRSRASIVLRRPAVITVAIYRGTTLVKRVWTGTSVSAGTHGYTWNGGTSSGAYATPARIASSSGRRAGSARPGIRARSWSSRTGSSAVPAGRILGADGRRPRAGGGTWVVLPTYDEADNVGPITAAILARFRMPISWSSTTTRPTAGRIADELAAHDRRIRVRHRAAKQGLGRAYLDGFGIALESGASAVVQMDADFSHDPAALTDLIAPIVDGSADLVIGSRYTPGGAVVDWGLGRRLISRGGSLFAWTVLGLGPRDLTGAGSRRGARRPWPRSRSMGSTPAATSSRSR